MACEKCWADAGARVFINGGSQADHYIRILHERGENNPCTPEEQCGDLHTVIKWKNRPDSCMCGLKDADLDNLDFDASEALGNVLFGKED